MAGSTLSPRPRRLARLCWAIDRNEWLMGVTNLVAALLFVAGCVAFYRSAWYVAGVTLFLVGSGLMAVSSAAELFRRHGPVA